MDRFSEKLKELRSLNQESPDYIDQIFQTDWNYTKTGGPLSETKEIEVKSEKAKVIESLEKMVKSSPDRKVSFEGGEISVYEEKSTVECRIEDGNLNSILSTLELRIAECTSCVPLYLKTKKRKIHDLEKFEIRSQKSIDVLFVSDYPRIDEQESFLSGEGFLLFKKMVAAMKLKNSEYAISSLIKCYTDSHENRINMMGRCLKYLYLEILYYRPKFVISFGVLPTSALLGKERKLSEISGSEHEKTVKLDKTEFKFKIIPLYHPDYLLINPDTKRSVWNALQKVMKTLGKV